MNQWTKSKINKRMIWTHDKNTSMSYRQIHFRVHYESIFLRQFCSKSIGLYAMLSGLIMPQIWNAVKRLWRPVRLIQCSGFGLPWLTVVINWLFKCDWHLFCTILHSRNAGKTGTSLRPWDISDVWLPISATVGWRYLGNLVAQTFPEIQGLLTSGQSSRVC